MNVSDVIYFLSIWTYNLNLINCCFRALKITWEIWTLRWLAVNTESQLYRWLNSVY